MILPGAAPAGGPEGYGGVSGKIPGGGGSTFLDSAKSDAPFARRRGKGRGGERAEAAGRSSGAGGGEGRAWRTAQPEPGTGQAAGGRPSQARKAYAEPARSPWRHRAFWARTAPLRPPRRGRAEPQALSRRGRAQRFPDAPPASWKTF